MSDDMDFVPLTIAEVGRNNESGTTVLEQINKAIFGVWPTRRSA